MMIRFQTEEYQCRFFDRFDQEAREFEDKLRVEHSIVDSLPWPRISFYQSYKHLQTISDRYFVLQMGRRDSARAYQIAVIERASRLPLFRTGIIPYWIPALEPEALRDQAELLKTMGELCLRHTSLMSLRMHCYLPGDNALGAAEKLLRDRGFEACDRQAPAKTRIIDLRPSMAEVLAELPTQVRTKVKIKKPEEMSLGLLSSREQIPALQSALKDSFQRSTAEAYNFEFETLFKTLEDSPESAAAFGFFLSDEPASPKAFISGVASPPLFEYTTAGSRSDARLRKFPFNYILLWRLVEAAKAGGALLFDMGGITDGTPDDPLAGISDFKRRFPGFELSIGREGVLELSPLKCRLFSFLQTLKKCFRGQ